MYYCTDCGKKFENPPKSYKREGQGLREIHFCPFCCSEEIRELQVRYCRCCGRALPDRKRWYCNSECKERGERLWKLQQERVRRIKDNSLTRIVAKIEQYNKAHGKNYSYGYFVANILPKMSKEQAKEFI